MRESTRQFLEHYNDKIDDTKALLTLGRSMLKDFEYIDLLITLNSADIRVNESDIFNLNYDKHVVTWETNDTLIHSFYNDLDKNNLAEKKTFVGLDNLTRSDFVKKFRSQYGYKTDVFILNNGLSRANYKLNDLVDIFTTINEDDNNLEVHAKLRDNHNNPLILRTIIRIGHFYDHVGYGWNQQRFKDRLDYLTRIIQDIIS